MSRPSIPSESRQSKGERDRESESDHSHCETRLIDVPSTSPSRFYRSNCVPRQNIRSNALSRRSFGRAGPSPSSRGNRISPIPALSLAFVRARKNPSPREARDECPLILRIEERQRESRAKCRTDRDGKRKLNDPAESYASARDNARREEKTAGAAGIISCRRFFVEYIIHLLSARQPRGGNRHRRD